MLATRLWMGSLLVALAVGMLVFDQRLAPWFPFLFVFQLGLTLIGAVEMILLLGPGRAPQRGIALAGVFLLGLTNWVPHWLGYVEVWSLVSAVFAGLMILVMLFEMAMFLEPARSLERMALTIFVIGYLGVLPCFFSQLRWLSADLVKGSVALALAIFVPKCCDIGAYFTGRLFGRHAMTPVLSPKKTWEGAIGGLTLAALVAIAIDRYGPAPLLRNCWGLEIGFGVSVGVAGMLGDLAESLFKRDCRKKDASVMIPGFGGVLDVLDAIVFSAPLSYLWLQSLANQ